MNNQDTLIESNCHVDQNVKMGYGNKILRNSIIWGPCEIGNNNVIGPNVVIGAPAQHTRDKYYDSTNKKIKIGNNCIIREFCSIQKPYDLDMTVVEDDVYIMEKVHIPHDAKICNNSIICPGVVLGGNTQVLEGANLGINSSAHQETIIGQYSMIGMGVVLKKNVKPFSLKTENKPLTINLYALKKFGFEELKREIHQYILRETFPTTPFLINTIKEFELLSKNSGRPVYK